MGTKVEKRCKHIGLLLLSSIQVVYNGTNYAVRYKFLNNRYENRKHAQTP